MQNFYALKIWLVSVAKSVCIVKLILFKITIFLILKDYTNQKMTFFFEGSLLEICLVEWDTPDKIYVYRYD